MQIPSLNFLTKQNFMRPHIRSNKGWRDVMNLWYNFVVDTEGHTMFNYTPGGGYVPYLEDIDIPPAPLE